MFVALLAMAMVAEGPLAAPVRAAACPSVRSGQRLRGGAVFDGPPEDKAMLKPEDGDEADDGTSTWPGLRYVYKAGRTVWLGCSYTSDGVLSYVEVKHPVAMCRYVERRKRVDLSCR